MVSVNGVMIGRIQDLMADHAFRILWEIIKLGILLVSHLIAMKIKNPLLISIFANKKSNL